MKFEIDFNRDSEHNLLKILNKFDVKEEDIIPHPKYGPFSLIYINLKNFEELELLLHTVDYSTGGQMKL